MAYSKKSKTLKSKGSAKRLSSFPAPKKEQIKGSSVNKPFSASSKTSGTNIVFSESTTTAIKNKIESHNKKYPSKKVNLATAKAVVRRGMGAYSVSHRPTISSGKPNSRVAWGLARLDAFLTKKSSKSNNYNKSINPKYIQDDDLL